MVYVQAAPMTPSTPPQSTSEHLLISSLEMLEPLVRLWVAYGIPYPTLANELKQLFIDAARSELAGLGHRPTDAAISVRSGVHRKEVRTRSAVAADGPTAATGQRKGASYAEQVFARWLTDAAYRDPAGRPAALPIAGPKPSFESLALSITRDVSRRTLLDELGRLGLVREVADQAIPQADAVVPSADLAALITHYAAQLKDHLAAGAANIQAAQAHDTPPFLEQSMYANGLSEESVEQLKAQARRIWTQAFEQMVNVAQQRLTIDQESGHNSRLRFGVYFYSEKAGAAASEGLKP